MQTPHNSQMSFSSCEEIAWEHLFMMKKEMLLDLEGLLLALVGRHLSHSLGEKPDEALLAQLVMLQTCKPS